MANPKRKISKGRRDRRRFQAYTRRLKAPNWSPCPRCHEPKLPHFVCPSCGFYKGRRVLVVKERKRAE